MTMPLQLVLVRHGEAEGNVANDHSRAGDHGDFTEEFRSRHSSEWRLSDKGVRQAEAAGVWLARNNLVSFDRHYCSEYLRAMETAALLNLPEAQWSVEFQLRERDHGLIDVLPENERQKFFADYLRQREIHRFYWCPPGGGESMAQLCTRLRTGIVSTLHRERSDQRVIIVCHGETMRGLRVIVERTPPKLYHELETADDPGHKTNNCQIIQYSRIDPDNPKHILPYIGWGRSLCPWDLSRSPNKWYEIDRRRYSNEELLETVRRVPRLINR